MNKIYEHNVSVITAFKNAENYIEESVESILNQTLKNFELLLIDDGSTDGTSSKINKYLNDARVRYFRNEKSLGKPANLNLGITQSRSEFIAIFDGDDISSPDRLQKQLDLLKSNTDIAAVGSYIEIINEAGEIIDKRTKPTDPDYVRKTILFYNPLLQPSVMIRKSVIEEIGLYNESYTFAQDIDMWYRLIFSGYNVTNIPEFLLKYRIHSNNVGKNHKKVAKLGLKLKKENIKHFNIDLTINQMLMMYTQFFVEYFFTDRYRRLIESLFKKIIIGRI